MRKLPICILFLILSGLALGQSTEPIRDYIFAPAHPKQAAAPPAGTTPNGMDDGVTVSYTSFDNLSLTLTRYEGANVAILLSDNWKNGLTVDERRKFIAYADVLYLNQKSMFGGEPAAGPSGDTKLTIAVVPNTCGVTTGVVGCGYVGNKGVELVDAPGLPDLKVALAANRLPKVLIHEMTHNFDLLEKLVDGKNQSYVTYGTDQPHAWTNMAEFAILGYSNAGGFDNGLTNPNKQANLYDGDALFRFGVKAGFIPYIQLANAGNGAWADCARDNKCAAVKDYQAQGGFMLRLFWLVGTTDGAANIRKVFEFLRNAVATRTLPATPEDKADLLIEAFSESTQKNFSCVATQLKWYVSSALSTKLEKYSNTPLCQDNDKDGYSAAQGDTDDSDAAVHPGATELGNGIDDDSNGVVDDIQKSVTSGGSAITDVTLPVSIASTFPAGGQGAYLRFTLYKPQQVSGRLNVDGAPNACYYLFNNSDVVGKSSIDTGAAIANSCLSQLSSYHAADYRQFTWDLAPGAYIIYTYGTGAGAYRLILYQPDGPSSLPDLKPPVSEGSGFRFSIDGSKMNYTPDASRTQVKFMVSGPGGANGDWVGSTAYASNASVSWPGPLTPGWYGVMAQMYKVSGSSDPGDPHDKPFGPVWFQVPDSGAVQVCTYTLDTGGKSFDATGGTAQVTVTTASGCAWSANSRYDWITITDGASGSGTGTVSYRVSASSGIPRSGAIVIAGLGFDVEQLASSTGSTGTVYNFFGSLAQFASGGDWASSITLVNTGTTPAFGRLNFSNNSGADLVLKWQSPQLDLPGDLIGSALDRTLEPNAAVLLTSQDSSLPAEQVGSARLSTSGNGIDGFGIFRVISSGQEAVVPLETRNSSSYYLAFDNTGSLLTGVAIANLSPTTAYITVTIFNESGNQVKQTSVSLGGFGHDSFMLTSKWSETEKIRGVVRFDTPAFGRISVLGIRAFGGAITTIPVLADVTSAGGALAHIAAGGDWETYFTLVNTGSEPANATLSFYGDGGAAVPLPLTVNGSTTTEASTTQQLPANGAVTILAGGASLVTGSARLTTMGNVSAFAIFRVKQSGQEAVVPMETRNPTAFVLPFDNTGALATGIGVANLGSQPAAIGVIVRDQDGNQIDSGTVNLSGQGHDSFMLNAGNRFPQSTNGRRGVVEFRPPSGGKISIIGIRAFGGAITTIPVSTKYQPQ